MRFAAKPRGITYHFGGCFDNPVFALVPEEQGTTEHTEHTEA